MKRKISLALASLLALGIPLSFTGCSNDVTVLRIASWEEYIDEGGEDSYIEGSNSLVEDFEIWYRETFGQKIRVEYIPLQDNEQMYAKIDKFQRQYDLLCPSEYMIMKLIAEDRLEKLPDSFYDVSAETNYYAKNVAPYIKNVFIENEINGSKWWDYTAGYMWGTTGFIYNADKVNAEDVKSWNVYFNSDYSISAKNNVRDSYFAGLGMYYEQEILAMDKSAPDHNKKLTEMMNQTDSATMKEVEKLLKKMRSSNNFWGFETDNAKSYLLAGDIDISYQWSGDAVYIMDEAESEDRRNPIRFDYCVPESASNLWFDGWVMMKGANVDAATAFINFVSRPDNAVRNMYYIGYTSCVGGEEVFDYVVETYGAEDGDETAQEYDLSSFFGEGYSVNAPLEQHSRQLFAQYPTADILGRCCIMQYFDADTNKRANTLWKNVNGD